jgi:O-antigen/teichoic acid export membrane protein
VLEAYAWQLKKSVLTNFLREVQFRLFSTILIVLFFAGVVARFDNFIKIYSLTYLFIAAILLAYLLYTKQIHFTFNASIVTRKFIKKIVALASFVWSGGLVYNVANVFDTLVIAAVIPNGLAFAGIYTLAQNIASLIQAPQRGIISASIAPLSKAWKDKDYGKIQRIYHRSSINQLIFSIGMFILIWLNFTDGVFTFSLKETYIHALPVFLLIGLMRILDMGTGLNAQIIGTSTFWRFEFFTGIILLAMALPLNYVLTKSIGVIGPAISNFIAFTIYNSIRCVFLYRKFKMQPFSMKSIYTVLLGAGCYLICHYAFRDQSGFLWIVIRSSAFVILYGLGVYYLRLSPDIKPVLGTIRKKVGM